MQQAPKKSALLLSSPPHIRAEEDTRSIMADVLIALIPVLALSVYFTGWRALASAGISVASCLLFEWLCRRWLRRSFSLGDCSAAVTGLLTALCLPAAVPLWLLPLGGAFSMIAVKQLFGGLGKNFLNPALAARALLMTFPAVAALPLAGAEPASLPSLFLGHGSAVPGEASALLLLLGGGYLVVRKVLALRIPVSFLGAVALLSFCFPGDASRPEAAAYGILTGGAMLGAIFMATDYATSPVTRRGQWIYGVCCGVLTVLLRKLGSASAVYSAILIMNVFVWVIDRYTRPRRFGDRLAFSGHSFVRFLSLFPIRRAASPVRGALPGPRNRSGSGKGGKRLPPRRKGGKGK